MELQELAGSRVRYGCRRLTVMLKREGWKVNAKRIYRLYIEEGLVVRTRTREQRAQRQRIASDQALAINQRWSMDLGLLGFLVATAAAASQGGNNQCPKTMAPHRLSW